jgi:site-specific recombinase XerD
MTSTEITVITLSSLPQTATAPALPAAIVEAGEAARFVWEEFFSASISNPYTRATYKRAVCRFLEWLEPQGIPLARITPGMVGSYFNQHPGSIPTKKVHLAAIRKLFDNLVIRHVMALNPAASVRGQRYQVVEGKTPEISPDQARRLLASIRTSKDVSDTDEVESLPVALRDAAIVATLIYTAARAGAVARLRIRDLTNDGTQYLLRFAEKGGKSREIPVRHDLQQYLLDYMGPTGLAGAHGDNPLFRSADRRTGRLTTRPITGQDVCRIVKRRLKDAGLPTQYSPHSFRVATITDLLIQGAALEDVSHLAGHSDVRVTRLYDRRHKQVTRKIVDKISI